MPSPRPSPDVLTAFHQAASLLRQAPSIRIRGAMRRSVLLHDRTPCWHCGSTASRVERLVAERAGGIARLENLIAVCPTCAVFSDYRDALELAHQDGRVLSKAQTIQRDNALALSLNHAVPPSYRTSRAVCRAYLVSGRWSHPRVAFAVAPVDGGVLAEPISGSASAASSALLEAMERAGGKTVGSRCVYVPEEAWLAIAWEAIERHGILRRVVLDGENARVDEGKAGTAAWREGWGVLLEGVDDVRRNRARLPHRGYATRHATTPTLPGY